MLDGRDNSLRAARGNFGLVWVQSKGKGLQRYADWSRQSAQLYGAFAEELQELTGVSLAHRNEGGLALLLGDAEVEQRELDIEKMRQQAGSTGYDCEILEHSEVQKFFPDMKLGKAVSGASYCPHDGDINPLKLLRALHAAFSQTGGRYHSRCTVESIDTANGTFTANTANGRFEAPKIVLAAGHGITHLAPSVGIDAPIQPQRGQVLITERIQPRMAIPLSGVRQTDEGGFQLGSSEEDLGFDDGTSLSVVQNIAGRAVQAFPQLASVRLVRNWGCVRVLTPDKCAIYEESVSHPGAYVATSHSGVTLAAINARLVSKWIATGEQPENFNHFSASRFHVQAA
ncbi:MAG: FAD-binding oxidoreductase, partial [Alphaproteobacteria bacterium]|nr:FAD-binding oxidoreductase [Alphaproteobacteria bacterium]